MIAPISGIHKLAHVALNVAFIKSKRPSGRRGSQAEGQPENDEEWQAAVDFIGSHGQSLDWILRGEPGVMICGEAASSDRARSNKDDPIFETIEAHKRAAAALNVEIYKTDPLEKEIPRERRQTTSLEEIVEEDDPRWLAHQRELDRLSDAECDAECELASVVPTSIAGILALLEYAVKIEAEIGFRETYFDPDEARSKLVLLRQPQHNPMSARAIDVALTRRAAGLSHLLDKGN